MTEESQLVLTAKQSRTARALLAWTWQELATRAGLDVSTVSEFERERQIGRRDASGPIRTAFEQAGVRFLPDGLVIEPPLPRLGATTETGAPITWVDATDLAQWAERREGQGALPALVAKLVRAGGGSVPHFPSEEGIQFAGWDGVTRAANGNDYLPEGVSGWEIGTQREGIAAKADKDYEKRTKEPGALNPAESTFVFVTPRHWPEKDSWEAGKRAEGVWRGVRAYDGTDLVAWLALYPPVGRWLAVATGKRPVEARLLHEVWQEWSLATEPPLPLEVVLADHDQDVVAVLKWLRAEPAILALQGETVEEVAAFAYAAMRELPDDDAGHYLARTILAESSNVARILADSYTPLIIVVLDPKPGLPQAILAKGHHVLAAYSGSPILPDEINRLGRPTREGLERALEVAGVPEERASRLARECSRSLVVLRRLMPALAAPLPLWAQTAPPHALLAALLAGAWDENSELDREILARLARTPYETFLAGVAPFAGEFDRPLVKVGSVWKVRSPQDAFLLLAPYLSSSDVDRFEEVVTEILAIPDSRYEMNAEERWYDPLNQKPRYSEFVRRGLGESLILFALYGKRAAHAADPERRPARVLKTLLEKADGQRWRSLSEDFQLLAEAAPERFLELVQHSLDEKPTPAISALFKEDPDPTFGREYLSNLLWALESLAWSPDLFSRVAVILAQLAQIDPGGRLSNRPRRSLRNLFVLWCPQTSASFEDRLKVLDVIRRRYGEIAWRLMLDILPSVGDTFSPSAKPRWRDMGPDTMERAPPDLVAKGVEAISSKLLEDVGLHVSRWDQLLKRLRNLTNPAHVIDRLAEVVPKVEDQPSRTELWAAVRRTLNHHWQLSEQEGGLSSALLASLEDVYAILTPSDATPRSAWLFNRGACLPNPPSSWHEEQEGLQEARLKGVAEVLTSRGVEGALVLAESVDDPHAVGVCLVVGGIDIRERVEILDRSLKSTSDRLHMLAHGLIAASFQSQRELWAEQLIHTALRENWDERAILTILLALPQNRWLWGLAHQAGHEIELGYWQRMQIFSINDADQDIELPIEKLIAAERAHDAVTFLGHRIGETVDGKPRGDIVRSDLLVEVLKEAVRQPWVSKTRDSATMFQHYVVKILQRLDSVDDVPQETMFELEWAYLPLLEYSQRSADVIMRALARDPSLFVELLCAIYRPETESGMVEPPPDDLERAERMASQAFRILRQWNLIPGAQPDGKIETAALEAWVSKARELAKARGRDAIADLEIGKILSASPPGSDGVWPSPPVREVIEIAGSAHLEEGFVTGHFNRRGVTGRLPGEGGKQERNLVEKFEGFAKATRSEWPRTSGVLDKIARGYAEDARGHDDDTEQFDW